MFCFAVLAHDAVIQSLELVPVLLQSANGLISFFFFAKIKKLYQ